MPHEYVRILERGGPDKIGGRHSRRIILSVMSESMASRPGDAGPKRKRRHWKDGQPQRSNERLFMQFLAFGGCADAAPLADALARAKISGVLYEDVNDPRGIGVLTLSEDPDFFLDRLRPVLNGPAALSLIQKQELRCSGTSADRLRAGSARKPAASSAAHRAQPGVEVGGVVSAAAQRPVRATAGRRAARHSRRARRDRHVVRRRRLRPRRPAGLPRPRQGRQRLRHRADREGPVSALRDRAGHEKDAADVAIT